MMKVHYNDGSPRSAVSGLLRKCRTFQNPALSCKRKVHICLLF